LYNGKKTGTQLLIREKNELNIDRYGSLKEQPNANVPRERDDKMVDKQHTTTSRTIYVIKKT
jgi:hypothetical protein